MPVVVRCPSCNQDASVPETLHGQAVLCPRCQSRFTAPDVAPTQPAANRPLLPPPPAPPMDNQKTCIECHAAIRRAAVVCPSCGVPQPGATTVNYPHPAPAPFLDTPPASNRILAGVFALLLGCLGVHKFVLGYNKEGVIMLAVTILGCPLAGVGPTIMWVIGIVEGCKYLSKSDAEFHHTYIANRKEWF